MPDFRATDENPQPGLNQAPQSAGLMEKQTQQPAAPKAEVTDSPIMKVLLSGGISIDHSQSYMCLALLISKNH